MRLLLSLLLGLAMHVHADSKNVASKVLNWTHCGDEKCSSDCGSKMYPLNKCILDGQGPGYVMFNLTGDGGFTLSGYLDSACTVELISFPYKLKTCYSDGPGQGSDWLDTVTNETNIHYEEVFLDNLPRVAAKNVASKGLNVTHCGDQKCSNDCVSKVFPLNKCIAATDTEPGYVDAKGQGYVKFNLTGDGFTLSGYQNAACTEELFSIPYKLETCYPNGPGQGSMVCHERNYEKVFLNKPQTKHTAIHRKY